MGLNTITKTARLKILGGNQRAVILILDEAIGSSFREWNAHFIWLLHFIKVTITYKF